VPEDTAILVVGGYGAVGRHIVARLHASLPRARIIVAGRALDKAQALADTFASRVSARQIDLTSRTSIDAVFPLASLVVLNTEAGTQMAARACIDHGISMVTVAASVPVLRALEALSAQARAAQVTLVTEVGLGPGLTNLMLHEVVRQLPGATVAEVIVQLGLIGEHGAEAMDWTLARSLEARSAVRIDPALPAIGRHVIAVDFVDPDKMKRELHVDTVFSALALSPKWSTRLLPVLAPVLARFPTLLSVSQPVLTGVFAALRLTGDSVRLIARARSGQHSALMRMNGRNQSQVTGVVAAKVVERLLTLDGGGKTGVVGIADIVNLAQLRPSLEELGCRFSTDDRPR